MRSIVASTIAASLAAAGLLAVVGSSPAAAAARQYAWCERTDTTGFTPSCTFTSYAQCMATVSGQRGDCVQNPYLAYNRMQQPRGRNGRAMRSQPTGYDNGWDNGWNNNGWNQRW
ncbi:MAG: DUF3551 domain-containing protein [Tardiphaga sp.]